MATLRPFAALRPAPESAPLVAAVPYDVINRDEAAELSRGNRLSFLHVSRSEADLPPATDPYSPAVYEKARANFDELIRSAPLIRDPEPSIYVYQLRMGTQVQTGIASTFSIDEYDSGVIKKHEKTRKDKEDDRTRHLLGLGAQTGPVFLAYRGRPGIQALVRQVCEQTPLYDFTATDGVRHTLWKTSRDTSAWVREFAQVPCLYIADGHHRAASASRVREELRRANPTHTGRESYNFFLAVAFPAEELKILPYNRVLKDLNGMTENDLLSRLEKDFVLTPGASPGPARGEFTMLAPDGRWIGLKPRAPASSASGDKAQDAIARLDVSVLQNRVLAPLFGIEDPRTDKRIDFVGGIRGTKELERLLRSGEARVAFSMHATTLEDLMQVSDQGGIMPPKSTWFEPKLRDGLLSHPIRD